MGIREVFGDFDKFEAQVAAELRAQRRRANISLAEMATRLGLHQNTVGKLERREFGIGLDIIYGYGKVLNRPMSTFIGKDDRTDIAEGNPVAELSEEEMCSYSQLIQDLFNVFSAHKIKLSPNGSVDATKLVARAIIDRRSDD